MIHSVHGSETENHFALLPWVQENQEVQDRRATIDSYLREVSESPRVSTTKEKEMGMTHENGPQARSIPIDVRKDGIWLRFDNPSGNCACVNLQSLLNESAPIIHNAISEWANAILQAESGEDRS